MPNRDDRHTRGELYPNKRPPPTEFENLRRAFLALRRELYWVHRELHLFKEFTMATQADQAATLRNVLAQQQKTAGEIATVQSNVTSLTDKVAELQAIIDGIGVGGDATQELIDAVEAVRAQAQVVDDSIPDAPPPP